MSHTALSLSKSPQPSVLEIRILANHSSDGRFAFLKGRWRDTWIKVRNQVRDTKRLDSGEKEKEEAKIGALMGGYESSNEEEDDDEVDGDAPEPSSPPPPPPPPDVDPAGQSDVTADWEDKVTISSTDEEAKRRERRRRAEEWKRKRAA